MEDILEIYKSSLRAEMSWGASIHSSATSEQESNIMHEAFNAFVVKNAINSIQNKIAYDIISQLVPLADAPPINFEITPEDKDLVINRYTPIGVSILSIDTDGDVFVSFTPYKGDSRYQFFDHDYVLANLESLAYRFMAQ